jgi:V/A-type H+/Na+-transporting ATPase subunit D
MSDDVINVSPTRSELMDIRDRCKLAVKGHSLLKKKQDVLIFEFFKIVKTYKKRRKEVFEQLKETYKSLALDIAYTGIFMSRSASYSSADHFNLQFAKQNLMGIKIPQIKVIRISHEDENKYENSPQLAEARKKFLLLFENLIEVSSMEIAIKELAEEIKKVKRRVNSLEYIQIPKLQNTEKIIKFTLEEQERDNYIRLKSVENQIKER